MHYAASGAIVGVLSLKVGWVVISYLYPYFKDLGDTASWYEQLRCEWGQLVLKWASYEAFRPNWSWLIKATIKDDDKITEAAAANY